MSVLILALGFLAIGVFVGLVALERRGRSDLTTLIALVVVGFEAVAFGPEEIVPVGLFRIPLGPLDARPADLVIPAVLAARALARPLPDRISGSALLWAMFGAWYTVGAGFGFSNGLDLGQTLNQLRNVYLLLMSFALLSTVEISSWRRHEHLDRVAKWAVGLGLMLAALRMSVRSIALPLGISSFGIVQADGATVLSSMGAVLFPLALVRTGKPRTTALFASALLLAAPLLGNQGAALAALGVSSIVLVSMGFASSRLHRLSSVTPTEVFLVVLAVLVVAIPAALSSPQVTGVATDVSEALFGDEQETTSQLRRILWSDALEFVSEDPIIGQGVGFRQQLPATWPEPSYEATAHNVPLDVLLRSGIPGFAIFCIASLASVRDGVRAYSRSREPMIAALALGSLAAMAGLFAKGMVESVLDKTRLVVVIGSLFGLLAAARRSSDADMSEDRAVSELETSLVQ